MNSLRDPRRRPLHPGAILREDVLPSLSMTQAEFAKLTGLSEADLSDLLQEKSALSEESAHRIAVFLKTTTESWVRMQQAVDAWDEKQLIA